MEVNKGKLPIGADRQVLENQPGVSLVKMTVRAGTKPPRHAHPYDQIDYMLEGEAHIMVGEEIYHLKAGQSLFIPGEVEHGFLMSETDQTFLEIFVPGREDL